MDKRFLVVLLTSSLFASPLARDAKERYLALEKRYQQYLNTYQTLSKRVEESRNPIASLVQGRLTVVSGTAVPTTDQASPSTLYFTPYLGNKISLYGTTGGVGRWQIYNFSQLSLALSGLTTDKNYDVFIYNNAGTLTLELSAAWSTDTARTDALTTQNGIYVKSGSTTKRYLGTIRATGATTTTDTVTQRYVWNYYNRVERALLITDATNTWTYASATFQQARATATNRVRVVVGINESLVRLVATGSVIDGTTDDDFSIGIGVDSTTTNSALLMGAMCNNLIDTAADAAYLGYPGIGYHAFNWLEASIDAVSLTFWGDGNTVTQNGMMGTIDG